jgi:CheY-like chemotaxis protein
MNVLGRLSLRSILITGAVTTAIGFMALVGFGSIRAVRTLVIETSLERNELVARELASDYEQFLLLHLAAVETVAKHAAAAPRLEMASLYPILERAHSPYQALWGIGIADHAGKLVAVDPPVTSEGTSPIGVDLSDREWFKEIFDRFHQADSSTTRRHGGLGLGLSLVKHVVELHRGTVVAESPGPDRGATFTVTLPVAAPVPLPAADAGAPPADTDATATMSLDGVRVLLVDDHRETLELFTSALERRGADVRTAADVSGALAIFAAWRPDVLVSDIAMPGDDGYALIGKIRALPAAEGGRVPAVAVTAYGSHEDRLRALAAGFQAHVAKPLDPSRLVRTVAALAGRAAGPA